MDQPLTDFEAAHVHHLYPSSEQRGMAAWAQQPAVPQAMVQPVLYDFEFLSTYGGLTEVNPWCVYRPI